MSGKSVVLLIDHQQVRRTGLVRWLEDWTTERNLLVLPISTAEQLPFEEDFAVAILSLGSVSVGNEDSQRWIKSLTTFARQIPLVILSERQDGSEIRAAFREGATAYIQTNLDPHLALEILDFVCRGGSYFPVSALLEERQTDARAPASSSGTKEMPPVMTNGPLAAHMRQIVRTSPEPSQNSDGRANFRMRDLTERQSAVLKRLSEGKPNKLIARDLDMTEGAVKVHVRQIMRKFGATNRTQVVLSAMRLDHGSEK